VIALIVGSADWNESTDINKTATQLLSSPFPSLLKGLLEHFSFYLSEEKQQEIRGNWAEI